MSDLALMEPRQLGVLRGATKVLSIGPKSEGQLHLVGLHVEVAAGKHVRLAVFSDRDAGWFWKVAGRDVALEGRSLLLPGSDASLEADCGCKDCITKAWATVTAERYSLRFAGDKFAVCLRSVEGFEGVPE